MIATRKALAKIQLRTAMSRKRGVQSKRIPRPTPPDAIEREYKAYLARLTERIIGVFKSNLLPRLGELVSEADRAHGRMDGYTDTLREVLQFILQSLGSITSNTSEATQARQIFDRVNAHAQVQVENQVEAIADIKISSVLPGGQEMADSFVETNVGLIKSIGQTLHDQVGAIVRQGLTVGQRPEAMADEIQERFNVSQSRADFIARDQVLKAYGQVTEERHKAIGINKFVWRTSKDERVRGNPTGLYPPRPKQHNHWELEGQVFEYAKAPYGGPGRDYQCRCTAEPYLADLLGDDFEPDQDAS
jgi:SPP1 gp7 family putative phage head morphogenesis protein